MSDREKTLICTECWWSFKVINLFLEELDVICPDCGFCAPIIGHWVNGTGFCKECYSFGCNAVTCNCDCHVLLDEKLVSRD